MCLFSPDKKWILLLLPLEPSTVPPPHTPPITECPLLSAAGLNVNDVRLLEFLPRNWKKIYIYMASGEQYFKSGFHGERTLLIRSQLSG